MKKFFHSIRFLLAPLICAAVVLLLTQFVFFIGYVPSDSMEPAIPANSWIIGTRIYGPLEVGDVIIFAHEGKTLVKRIAAASGDMVYIDDNAHMASINTSIENPTRVLMVPEDSYFLLGDHSAVSIDSRYWKSPFIDKAQIIAKSYCHEKERENFRHPTRYH